LTAPHRSAIKLQKTEDYDLKKSYNSIGQLCPVLKDAKGRIFDGMHRKEADKNWPEYEVKRINDEKTFLIAKIVANNQRRKVSSQEKRQMLNELAQETKWSVDEIAEHTGFSASWVRKYLSQEFKNAEMSALASRKPKSSKHLCPKCGSPMHQMYFCSDCSEMEPVE